MAHTLKVIAVVSDMWIGVSRAGYSVREEVPFLLLVFGAPAAVALLVLWEFSPGY